MTHLPKSIIRVEDGMEFLLNEKTGKYYIDCPRGVDITKTLMFEYPYEALINRHHGGFFRVRTWETEADLEAMRKKWKEEMDGQYEQRS